MSQQVGVHDDCLTLLKILQTLSVCDIEFHKAGQGGKKDRGLKESHILHGALGVIHKQ